MTASLLHKRIPELLLGLGCRVLIACDGKTGMFAAESSKPSLIVLDMLTPDMDGPEVLRAQLMETSALQHSFRLIPSIQ